MIYTSISLVLLFWAGVFLCIVPKESIRVQTPLDTVVSSWTNDSPPDQKILHSPVQRVKQYGYFLHITDMHVCILLPIHFYAPEKNKAHQ
ncbi:hypothetical protein CLU79DRAFT_732654 [Phycomyces nitens]|nr:hypothetical protein CLU79DRAFT_732654 [Phycomyces nitens]